MMSHDVTEVPASRSLAGVATAASASSSAPALSAASRLLVPLLVAEAVAFAGLALSGKIPASLITVLRALLTL